MRLEKFRWNELILSLPRRPRLSTEIAAKAGWLTKLRWVAITAQLGCLIPGQVLEFLDPSDVPAYLAVVGALVAFNLLYPRFSSHLHSFGEWSLLVHLTVDLAALGLLLGLSHGCQNPLVALIYLHAALGPLFLSGARNGLFLAATCLCLATVCFYSLPPEQFIHGIALPREVKLVAELCVVSLIWQLTGRIATYLNDLHDNVRDLESRKNRIDNLRALGVMTASLSHAFATPLNTLKLRLNRLARSPLATNATIESDLSSALAAADQCEAALRALFTTHSKEAPGRIEDLVLVPFVEDVCRIWHSDNPNVEFKFTAEHSAMNVVCKVPGLVIARTLIDLLDNALQASEPPMAAITVSLKIDTGHARIKIADRGRGIAPEVVARLGEPFISNKATGAGLGLFSAYSLAEAFGGALTIRERDGGGTIVVLTLPAFGDEK